MIRRAILLPFKYLVLKKNLSLLWMLFTLVFGLFGIAFNIWGHLAQMGFYKAILYEFSVNSFYTYSIVLLASAIGSLLMKFDKDKLLWFSDIKLWLMVVLFIALFISAFLSQGLQVLAHHYWTQLVYFVVSLALATYCFCVCHIDEFPNKFSNLLSGYSEEEEQELKNIISQTQSLTKDKSGNKL